MEGGALVLPHVRDHGCGDRRADRRRGDGDRRWRHRRPRRDVRGPDHRRIDEPSPIARTGDRGRRLHLDLGLSRRRRSPARRPPRSPTRSCRGRRARHESRALRLHPECRAVADGPGAVRAGGRRPPRGPLGREPPRRPHPSRGGRRDARGGTRPGRPGAAQARRGCSTQWADLVVTMGCGDECPFIPGKRYEDWEFDDPSGRPVDEVRRIRDDIATRVDVLLADLARREEVSP